MFNITTFNKISNEGLKHFDKDSYSLTPDDISNADGVVLRSYKMHDTVLPDTLKAIARAGAGTNNVPVEKCSEKGIVVFNAPGANANGVKEMTLLALLASSRKVNDGIKWVNNLDGDVEKQVEKGKSQFAGPEIMGKTLGVVGLGAIGVLVANMGIKLGMKVIGYDPYISVQKAIGLSWDVKYSSSLDELFGQADYVSLHIPLVDKTKGFMDEENISKMKKGARLINMSRGGLVNDAAILKAIDEGRVSSFVTDFPTDDLINKNGVVCIPHLGASTPESEENCARMVVNQLIDYLENGNITNSVNFPNCSLERTEGTHRIVVLNKNVPNMIGSLTAVFSKYNANIIEMVNKSKGDYAYNIIDIAGTEVNEEKIEELKSIDGIIKVRLVD
ncbi:D-3-phosphoglycerate dehydrogenase [Dethiosulfatibacter aminovorans DSM 17477]|uniref:D-3-phosphoglycerate dehydrogenase n=1 Tax=Dethiosulfatibacter aminovorans DSM 17477 TaxID=1121476 RepID=A0A1M6JE90_9FIRM|nr:phosphoglycerate dehydrogenase [Dethiosulfatibacter aminovorans]SHJ44892.1 D-3-phosphoglycerate dehydrogenase [Dethiosulfatibacter aminovorans DSM 17477]